MTSVLIVDASVLTLGPAPKFIERGFVVVRDSWIVAVGTGDAPPVPGAQIINGRGKLLTPGLINAHTQSQSATLAGFGDRLSHTAFTWLTQAHTARRTPAETRLAVMLTAWSTLLSGTTAVIDHFLGQHFTGDDLEAALAAWHETGLRATVAIQFSDMPPADIMPAGSQKPDMEDVMRQIAAPQNLPELRDLTSQAIMRWQGRDGRIGVCPAPSNPERCTDAALLFCAELAERYDTGIHTELLETQTQARLAQQRHGTSSVGHLVELGVLSDRWTCSQCVWLDDADRGWMAEAGAIAVLNPESNARLGVGTADIPALRRAGVTMALGTDGMGATGNLSMHQAMRTAAILHRGTLPGGRPDWVSAHEALAMATSGGAAALRQPHLGAIAPGYLADLVLYRLDQPAWVPLNDPVCQLVLSESGNAVDGVIVAGKVLLANGRPTRFDPAALADEIREMSAALRHRNADLFTIARAVGEGLHERSLRTHHD